ncbi:MULTISPECIES: PIN domain-containing protein [unclassified Marinobacter]|uniref:type II toxin-antitoxin system VapC family toxin n=1 Tax=unclassified Marinobacter TaxID=83889 RepID=UPI00200E0BDD|nr:MULTISPECIES: PIN domain-containing protein [unclassified Marinobacter]UQG58269.1 PIN domain-containing protein [Marinobacter sp. M4C]UQG67077.1 PIN domain-containing protein [Marinobacter sp. M2C]UQG71355.1 PIN domain-containing protein [Marinobacter sp. M1C]
MVDTSVWAGHFRNRSTTLTKLLLSDRVLTHPMVVAELACGTPPSPRAQTLSDIGLLEPADQASIAEVRILIEQEKLYGLGCGLVDIVLLASTLITPSARLWTFDKRLERLAERFDIHYSGLKQ